jgi:hypothetical protein
MDEEMALGANARVLAEVQKIGEFDPSNSYQKPAAAAISD